jgi:hypothetical protein
MKNNNKKNDFKPGMKNWMALEWYSKWKPDKSSRSCPFRVKDSFNMDEPSNRAASRTA